MISEELRETILAAVNLDEWNMDENTLASEIPGWDSLSHVDVIIAIEQRFGVRFAGSEVLQLKNIGDLQRLVTQHLSR